MSDRKIRKHYSLSTIGTKKLSNSPISIPKVTKSKVDVKKSDSFDQFQVLFLNTMEMTSQYFIGLGEGFSSNIIKENDKKILETRYNDLIREISRFESLLSYSIMNNHANKDTSSLKDKGIDFFCFWKDFSKKLVAQRDHIKESFVCSLDAHFKIISNVFEFISQYECSNVVHMKTASRAVYLQKAEKDSILESVKHHIDFIATMKECDDIVNRIKEFLRTVNTSFLHEYSNVGIPSSEISKIRSNIFSSCSAVIKDFQQYCKNSSGIHSITQNIDKIDLVLELIFKRFGISLQEESKPNSSFDSVIDTISLINFGLQSTSYLLSSEQTLLNYLQHCKDLIEEERNTNHYNKILQIEESGFEYHNQSNDFECPDCVEYEEILKSIYFNMYGSYPIGLEESKIIDSIITYSTPENIKCEKCTLFTNNISTAVELLNQGFNIQENSLVPSIKLAVGSYTQIKQDFDSLKRDYYTLKENLNTNILIIDNIRLIIGNCNNNSEIINALNNMIQAYESRIQTLVLDDKASNNSLIAKLLNILSNKPESNSDMSVIIENIEHEKESMIKKIQFLETSKNLTPISKLSISPIYFEHHMKESDLNITIELIHILEKILPEYLFDQNQNNSEIITLIHKAINHMINTQEKANNETRNARLLIKSALQRHHPDFQTSDQFSLVFLIETLINETIPIWEINEKFEGIIGLTASNSNPRDCLNEFSTTYKSFTQSISVMKSFATSLSFIFAHFNSKAKTTPEKDFQIVFKGISDIYRSSSTLINQNTNPLLSLILSKLAQLLSAIMIFIQNLKLEFKIETETEAHKFFLQSMIHI